MHSLRKKQNAGETTRGPGWEVGTGAGGKVTGKTTKCRGKRGVRLEVWDKWPEHKSLTSA